MKREEICHIFDILIGFKNYYELKNYNLKQIDEYLWQLGKEYFLGKY